jgi:hypothetical protein
MPAQHHRLRLFRKHQPFRIAAYYNDGRRFGDPSAPLLALHHLRCPVLLPPFTPFRTSRMDPLFSDIVPPCRFCTPGIVASLPLPAKTLFLLFCRQPHAKP